MPRNLEKRLKQIAKQRHYDKTRTLRFVYGTLRKTGWMPKPRKHHKQRRKM